MNLGYFFAMYKKRAEASPLLLVFYLVVRAAAFATVAKAW